MANYKTGSQRYNDRMGKIFEDAKVLKAKYGTQDCDCRNMSSKAPHKSTCASFKPPEGTKVKKKEIAKKMKNSQKVYDMSHKWKKDSDKREEVYKQNSD